MLKYDYKIVRDEGNRTRTFVPNKFPTTLPDIVYIQGPNSSGKSTLLHLIAVAFWGLKLPERELNTVLREKLRNLLQAEHQNLTWDIEIDNSLLGLKISSKKKSLKNSEFEVRRKEKSKDVPMTADQFMREFRLIYDIPTDPLKRLPQLLAEIKNAQAAKGSSVSILAESIRKRINAVREAKDPNQEQHLQETLAKQNDELEKTKTSLERAKETCSEFSKYAYSKLFLQHKDQSEQKRKEIDRLKANLDQIKGKEKKLTREQSKLSKRMRELTGLASAAYSKASVLLPDLLPPEEKHRLKIWRGTTCKEEIAEYRVKNELRTEAKHYISVLRKRLTTEDSHATQEALLINKMIEILSPYTNSTIKIPGLEKSVDEFVSLLMDGKKKYMNLITRNKNISECIELLTEMVDSMREAVSIDKEYQQIVKDHVDTLDDEESFVDNDELQRLDVELANLLEKKDMYAKELIKLDVDEDHVDSLTDRFKLSGEFRAFDPYKENQLRQRLVEFEEEVDKLERDKERLERSLSVTLNDIKRIANRQPHKYQGYLAKLENALRVVLLLDKKLNADFNKWIDKLMKDGITEKDLSIDEKKYALEVSKYLGAKVGFFRHVDETFLLDRIDVVKNQIFTRDGHIFRFMDLGTGQGQSAYLDGLLSTSDERKVIALFDEVAMMDSSSLGPIFKKLNKLRNEKKLMLGIIVQKSEKPSVESLVS